MGKNEKIKKEEKKKTIKDFFSSLLFLRLLFCFLILFIIGLGVLIYRKERTEEKEIKPHITVPVYQAESDFVSILSSQLIDTFSDFADVLRFRVDAIKSVFIFFGAEIGF